MDGFGGYDDLHERIRQMFHQAKAMCSAPPYTGPFVYGFTMRFTDDGRPVSEEFGNVSPSGISGITEPITEVMENYDSVSVVFELPGVAKEDLDLRTTPESVSISVDTPFRKYLKEVRLSSKVRPETAVARYNNGVLEVNIKRAEEERAGKRVRII